MKSWFELLIICYCSFVGGICGGAYIIYLIINAYEKRKEARRRSRRKHETKIYNRRKNEND